jgi:hypothetical protein
MLRPFDVVKARDFGRGIEIELLRKWLREFNSLRGKLSERLALG